MPCYVGEAGADHLQRIRVEGLTEEKWMQKEEQVEVALREACTARELSRPVKSMERFH